MIWSRKQGVQDHCVGVWTNSNELAF